MQKLNPSRIPKFKNDLEKLPIFIPSLYKREDKINYHYSVDACEFYQQMLPQGFNKTKVWGFAGLCKDSNSKKIKYISYDVKNYSKDKYEKLLITLGINPSDFGYPAVIYVKDGMMYSNIINISDTKTVETFIKNYELQKLK